LRLASIERDIGGIKVDIARMDMRLDRIERRLGLVEPAPDG